MVNIKGSNTAKASDGAHLLIFLAWLLYTGNVKICAVEKSPKSEIYAISNLFF